MAKVYLRDVAYTRIKEALLKGDLSGSVSENELVGILDMSRTPIREALQRLKNENFIEIYPNRGIFIKEVTIKETNDLMDLRLAIEVFSITRIEDLFTDADLEFLEKNVEDQKVARSEGDVYRFLKLDQEYHKRFLEIFGNDHFIKVLDDISDRLYLHGLKISKKRGIDNWQSINDHTKINKYLRERDFDKVKTLMEEHIIRGKENYLSDGSS